MTISQITVTIVERIRKTKYVWPLVCRWLNLGMFPDDIYHQFEWKKLLFCFSSKLDEISQTQAPWSTNVSWIRITRTWWCSAEIYGDGKVWRWHWQDILTEWSPFWHKDCLDTRNKNCKLTFLTIFILFKYSNICAWHLVQEVPILITSESRWSSFWFPYFLLNLCL